MSDVKNANAFGGKNRDAEIRRTVFSVVMFLIATVFIQTANLRQISAQTTDKVIDRGDFKVGFSPATLKQKPKKKMPKEISDALTEVANTLNEFIAMPYDVYLNMDECGEPNAFYNPETKEITMCYEFYADFEEKFKQVSKNPSEIEDMSENAMIVFFFHELGHCLIDAWDLPATGREEDAVDQLAMFVLLDGKPEGEKMVMSAVTYFSLVSRDQNPKELVFSDEHSLDQQRFYDMLCQVYGSNPQENKKLLGNRGLPSERAERCEAEYERVTKSWSKLLEPYLK